MSSIRVALSSVALATVLWSTSVVAANQVNLPLELLTDGSTAQPFIATVSLSLAEADLANASEIYFVCSRCGRYAAPEFRSVKSPVAVHTASVRFVGGAAPAKQVTIPWLDVTNQNITLPIEEQISGGVDGGFYSIHATVPLTDAMRQLLVSSPGLNSIQFRFNGTDGASNGFRIIDIAIRDAQHHPLGGNQFVQKNPRIEHREGAVSTPDAVAGRDLWSGAQLVNSLLSGDKIQGKCSSCHASHGQDLQYFNYSDNAIQARATFHGLTADQGRQIVAYIRNANRELPYAANARPWNPVYQPGPGLDAQDVSQWAAGAGLDAVTTTANQAAKGLFGKDPSQLTQADVDRVMSPNSTLNTREMAIPIQLPDWNAWLPAIAPEDVWPEGGAPEGSFATGATFANGLVDPAGKYMALVNRLQGLEAAVGPRHDWSLLKDTDRAVLQTQLTRFGLEAWGFLGGGRGNHIYASSPGRWGAQAGAAHLASLAAPEHQGAGAVGAFSTAAFIERATSSMMQWSIVRQWELVQTFGLQGDQTLLLGDMKNGVWVGRGESRGWMFNTPGTFYVGPHMLYQQETMPDGSVRVNHFAWETMNASSYRTNSWYNLQLIINPGAHDKFLNLPVDWGYLFNFDQRIADDLLAGGATEAASAQVVRLLGARIKAGQYVNNGISIYDPNQPDLYKNPGFGSRAMAAQHLSPSRYMDTNDPAQPVNRMHLLDNVQLGLYKQVVNGSVLAFNTLFAGIDVGKWRRCAPTGVVTQFGTDEATAGFNYCLDGDPRSFPVNRAGVSYLPWYIPTNYQASVWGYAAATQLDVEPTRMAVWLDWIQRAWPNYSLPTATLH